MSRGMPYRLLKRGSAGAPEWLGRLGIYLPLGLGSGHDLMVGDFEPCMGFCANSVQPAWDSVSLSLHPSSALSIALNK